MKVSKIFVHSKGKIKMNDDKLNDIKSIFDSVRNIVVCAVLILGLPLVRDSFEWAPEFIVTIAVWFSISIIASLYILNLVWTINITKEKPKSNIVLYVCNIVFTLSISLLSVGVSLSKVWCDIFG